MSRTFVAALALMVLPLRCVAQPADDVQEQRGLVPDVNAPARALVLDTKAQALVAIDLDTGAVVGRADLGGTPELVLRSPDGARLAVIDPGPQKGTFCCGLQPKGPMTATLLDAVSLRGAGEVEIGWGVPALALAGFHIPQLPLFTLPSPDGKRVTVLCAGYRSKKPEEDLPRELVTFNLASGRIEGRVAIDREVGALWGTTDGQAAVLFVPATEKKDRRQAAEVMFVDLARQALVARLPLAGQPSESLMSPDGEWLFLLDPGSPSDKKEKNVDGQLTILSVGERHVAGHLDVGSRPRTLVWDEEHQTVLVPSDGPPVSKGQRRGGELRAFIGPQQIGLVRLPEEPHLLRLRGTRAYVAGRNTLSVADLDVLRVLATLPLDDADRLSELVFSPDDQRAFGLYEASSRLSVLDLREPRLVGSVTTGRGGVKFAKALGAVALSVAASSASYFQGQSVARTQGRNWFTYNVYNFGVAAPESSVVVRRDGRVAFALNTQTNDVTVVDAETASVVSKEAVKGRALAAFPNGQRFAVLGKDELHLFDVRAQRPGAPLSFEDAGGVALLFTPDQRTALAYGGKTLYLLDAETGRVRAQVAGLLSVGSILFDGGAAR